MADEKVQLPRELLDVERDAVGQVTVRRRGSRVGVEFGAAALQQLDERHGPPIERGMLGRRRRAQMRLQRDVAEILQRQDAERIRMAEHRRDRQRHLLEQVGDVGEGKRRELDRPSVQREHDRWSIGRQDPEVAAIRSIARQRHDPGASSREAALTEILVDAIAQLGAFNRALIGHELSRQG